jgi:hypothetical protein
MSGLSRPAFLYVSAVAGAGTAVGRRLQELCASLCLYSAHTESLLTSSFLCSM